MSGSQATNAPAAPVMRKRVISGQTMSTGLVLAALLAVYYVTNAMAYAETLSDGAANVVYVFGILLGVMAATIVLHVALSLGYRESVGRQWLLIGLGVAAFAVGDIVWMIIELGLGQDPYPSIADIFYPMQYVFFIAGIALAIRGYRSFVNIKPPMLMGALVAIASVGTVYATVLRPYVFPAGADELTVVGKLVSTLYPVGDVLFMLAPAVTLALVIRQLGTGRFAWPWWFIVAGAIVFAAADSFYSYADWAGIGTTALIDLGWIGAQLLFALGALVARDVYRS